MFWSKRKVQGIKITLKPLNGLGSDRKATLKFVKKFFKKSANYQQLVDDISSAKETAGCMFLYAEVKPSVAKKIQRLEIKLGMDVELLGEEVFVDTFKTKIVNKIEYFRKQKKDFVLSFY